MAKSRNIQVEDSTPTFPKVLTIVSTGGGISTGVLGVKGDAETEYRDGYVNLTPANIGFTIVEVDQASGTLSAENLNILKNNLHNYFGYEPTNGEKYIFRLSVRNGNQWTYSAVKTDLTGTMFIALNVTTGAYAYSLFSSGTQTELTSHVDNNGLHVSAADRTNWDSKVSATIESVENSNDDDKNLILE